MSLPPYGKFTPASPIVFSGCEHPFVCETADGEEISEADSAAAIRRAAEVHLLEDGFDGPLTVRARHSGRSETAKLVDGKVSFRYMGDGLGRS